MTSIDVWELILVGALILVAAVLAMAEVSITRMSRVRAYRLNDEGRRGAKALVRIADNPAQYLNVVLLLTLLVQLGGTTLATTVALRHVHAPFSMRRSVSHSISTARRAIAINSRS